jgi:hypothetical protein
MNGSFSVACTASFTPPPTSSDVTSGLTDPLPPNREPLRVLVIGSRTGVISTIHTLHRLGFAEAGEWSPLMPAPTSGEVMSILTRYLFSA